MQNTILITSSPDPRLAAREWGRQNKSGENLVKGVFNNARDAMGAGSYRFSGVPAGELIHTP